MDVSELLQNLNDRQRDAVCTDGQHTLVLAGAGSGKTRVLIHRIAWLIQVEKASADHILAVTFTNKAAGEMRSRLEQLMDTATTGMWVGTFHGLCYRLLRQHWQEAQLAKHFQIIDASDQQRLLRRISREMQLEESEWPVKKSQWYINNNKDEGLRVRHIDPGNNPYSQQMLSIYQRYETLCQRNGLVDFAELLLKVYEMWGQHPELLAYYQKRFQYILVDEFQDINTIQYAWFRLLSANNCSFVVGDDDQSIYGWRGAKIEHIQRFNKEFRQPVMVRLEQNYRSTQTILSAANQVIQHNKGRLGKKLWTDSSKGERVNVYAAMNERDEAQFVTEMIKEAVKKGKQYKDIAILYRSNAQSRILEESLIQMKMPYRIYGGLRFFERAEIKDALAYLRLVAHHDDDSAFERIINIPARSIGQVTVDKVRLIALEQQQSLWQSTEIVCQQGKLATRSRNALLQFMRLIQDLDTASSSMTLPDKVEYILQHSGLWEYYAKGYSTKGISEQVESRLENLKELISAVREFIESHEKQHNTLDHFLAYAALEAGEEQANEWEDGVQLMTLHSAKGLEFPIVFLTGLEENIFPHARCSYNKELLEEERRLCYVGITRAMEQLYLSYAECRRLYGKDQYASPSRFLAEIPEHLLHTIRLGYTFFNKRRVSISVSDPDLESDTDNTLQSGKTVVHPKFGVGQVKICEGTGNKARILVDFNQTGEKWLMAQYAQLQVKDANE